MGLTRNYYNWKFWFQNRYTSTSGENKLLDTSIGLLNRPVDSTSSDYQHYLSMDVSSSNVNRGYYLRNNWLLNRNLYAFVGSGDAKEDIDDLDLSERLANVSSSINNYNYENSESVNITTVYIITGQNNSSEEVTIKEVGIFKRFLAVHSTSYSVAPSTDTPDSPYYLFLRKVLDTPITVGPKNQYRIEVKLTENMGGGSN